MKSIACVSSLRAACQHTSTICPPLAVCRPVTRGLNVDFVGRSAITRNPCVTAVRTRVSSAAIREVSEAPPPSHGSTRGRLEDELSEYKLSRDVTHLFSPSPNIRPQSSVRSLCGGDGVSKLSLKVPHLPSRDRAEELATALRACVDVGLEVESHLVHRLTNECLELLAKRDVEVAQLCHLGEAAYALEGRQSAVLAEVLDCVWVAVEDEGVSTSNAARVYSLLALCYDPDSQQQALTLSTLDRRTKRLVRRLKPGEVSEILQSLMKMQERQTIPLVLRLSQRASQVFTYFSDDEVIKLLSALLNIGAHGKDLLTAMEKDLPGRLGKCDPELISTVMEYCLHMRCRSEPIFEAVAENFVHQAEKHSTLQIAKQIVAMGRLNYLPQCSSQMFKKLEHILQTRFSQFQPRSMIDVLHACMHLERFPLNYISKVFSPYFLERLQETGGKLDRNALGQLTQLHISTSLECTHYSGPRLPDFYHFRKFSSLNEAFETPLNNHLYRRVKGPLSVLLGGNFYSYTAVTRCGYTIDVEIYLDKDGYVLYPSQWEHARTRIALCLDDGNRFCSDSNKHHLLGKEATKRRHLRKMGYEVVQISCFEYDKLTTEKEKVQYLQKKIAPTIFKFKH